MDLEHPAITRTLKEGYPDGTGKPQSIYIDHTKINTNPPNYNRVEEDEQMDFQDRVKALVKMQETLKSYYDVIDVMEGVSNYSVQFGDVFAFYNLFQDTDFTIQENYFDDGSAQATVTIDGIEYFVILDNEKYAELEELINE